MGYEKEYNKREARWIQIAITPQPTSKGEDTSQHRFILGTRHIGSLTVGALRCIRSHATACPTSKTVSGPIKTDACKQTHECRFLWCTTNHVCIPQHNHDCRACSYDRDMQTVHLFVALARLSRCFKLCFDKISQHLENESILFQALNQLHALRSQVVDHCRTLAHQ
jgi:hypothetical protein